MEALFSILITYYWNTIQERTSISDLIDDEAWVDSLIHFCNYAFERAGSPSIYRNSAKEALRVNRAWLKDRERWSDDIESNIFETFTRVCMESDLENYNIKNNPMSPSDGGQLSMLRFAWYEAKNMSIAGWAATCINNDDLSNAFQKLKQIRGIGNKIASFYLRDIYILSGNSSRNIRDRHLIQPIDVWTRRAAQCFLNNKDASDEECATFLVNYEDKKGMQNGSMNIALWVLGAQIAEDEKTFIEFVQDIKRSDHDSLKNRFATKIADEREWLSFLEAVHNGI